MSTPSATICPDCRALIPATPDDRRAHREWHGDLTAKHRGVQKRIAELAETATRAADAVATLRRDVENTEIPEQVEPLAIEAWPADELEQPESTYLDDDEDQDDAEDEAAPASSPLTDYFTPRPVQ